MYNLTFTSTSGAQFIPQRPERSPAPLSFMQQRLGFLDQLQPSIFAHNIIYEVFALTGLLDVVALEQSLNEIVRRHEALRTTFVTVNEQLAQVIAPNLTLALRVVDRKAMRSMERQTEALRLAREEVQQPFDLAQGPLLRVTLVQLAQKEQVLLLTMHQIISDRWSTQVLLQELATLYTAFSSGKPSPLAELPIQYADFAVWQRQWLQGEVLSTQLHYWKQQLGGRLPVLQLPTDHLRPPIQTYRGARQSLVLSRTLTEAIKALSDQEGVTVFMTLLAAFKTLLYRYTGQEDIVVGSPIANRNQVETESLIGCFINMFALRTDIGGKSSFRELLGRVREVVLEAYAHQDLPFEKLVEELQPERELSRSPLFQVMFVLQNNSMPPLELKGLTLNSLHLPSGTTNFDLTLELQEMPSGLTGWFEYNTDLFEDNTVQRMAGHFQTLLEGVVANPMQSISTLPLLTELQRHTLLVEWNDTQIDYSVDLCIHQLFEAQVLRTPDVVAVVFDQEQLTYQQLNARANQLAHYLRTLGVGPDVLVGIIVERSLDIIVGLLGILKAGGAYVPLDPTYPKKRLAFMLEDAQVSVLLTQQRLVAELPEHEALVVCLDSDCQSMTQSSQENPKSLATAEHLAYVIYTSGSTGKPKGVQIPHCTVVNFLQSMRDRPGLTNQDILLAVTSLSFDIAALELFLPLVVGALLVVVSREIATSGALLLAELYKCRATAMQATPATWRLLLEAGWQGYNCDESWGSGRFKVLCGGESLSRDLANQLLERGADLWNLYGPTETTIWSTINFVESKAGSVPIGRPIANTQIYLLDSALQPVPVGVPGEVYIGGAGLARGYLNRPNLTAQKFIPNPFNKSTLNTQHSKGSERLYKTGDLARYLPDGNIEFQCRIDNQVKLRGYRIELGEIEAALSQHQAVRQTIVLAQEDIPGDERLAAYIVTNQSLSPTPSELRNFLRSLLPNYMVPSIFVMLETLPLLPNGKLDRKALPAAKELRLDLEVAYVPGTEVEQTIAAVWQEVLHVEKVGLNDNFFDLGGHSLLMAQVSKKLQDVLDRDVSIIELFKHPTISSLAQYLSSKSDSQPVQKSYDRVNQQNSNAINRPSQLPSQTQEATSHSLTQNSLEGIAIIGMSGRFPGAKNLDEFWQNLRNGVESISFFTEQELKDAGVNSAALSNPNYVKARAVIEDVEFFDAAFFGFSPREAEITDPQHRLFLECASEALESAGYNSETYKGSISVYGGQSGLDTYYLKNLYSNSDIRESVDDYQLSIANDKDFLTTRISYKLNLKGPSINVQTACSTSLVAISLACSSLRNYESDIALAGAVSIMVPSKTGYLYREGMIFSPDGHCRAFDASAQGTVLGSGVGIVVLKRLEDALADGDYIHAVIKGSAINNDGSLKVGYTAPSINGQAEVIAEAMALAKVQPETISYIEAHGTGTPIGDPIEIAALTQAFSLQTQKQGFCAIGSVKTNVGHLDTAAGITGLIKTVLALKHKLLPPSLHFDAPNPNIDFANSPFKVNTKLCEWHIGRTPRRAGVSSFGFGGTNAHVVLEEAPIVESSGECRPHQLLVISAKTSSALDTATANLVEHLKQHPDANLADVAYTLQVGRRAFEHRRILVCHNFDDAVRDLSKLAPQRVKTSFQKPQERRVAFMFPGQGVQYVNMARELYQIEPAFREQVNVCSELLLPHLGLDLRQVLYPNSDQIKTATQQLNQTALTQPALFVIEYALAKLWMQWGVCPWAMIGDSIGEYVAACLAGVFALPDALALVAARGRLMQFLPTGSMLVGLPELEGQFTEQVKKVKLHPPKIPYVSNLTGTWITAAQATAPSYWGSHLRRCVNFEAGLHELLQQPARILLEVGPSRTLSTLARLHPDQRSEHVLLSSLYLGDEQHSDVACLLNTLGQLWLLGIPVDWSGFYAQQRRHRLPLPTYPFERQRYWIEPLPHVVVSTPELPTRIEHTFTASSAIEELDKTVLPKPRSSRPKLKNAYIAPRNDMEQTIAAIWQESLGLAQVGIHDNFFELGGDSLVAVSLFAQVKKIFSKNLPLVTIFQGPTVEQLASIICQEESSKPWSSLVAIQTGGGKPPFFSIHCGHGEVAPYYSLAAHLGSEYPVYALQPQGLDEKQLPHSRIEDMAADYIREIRTVQPEGPYFLGGFSLGGKVAFEMAQQLHTQGQKVAILALFDTQGPDWLKPLPIHIRVFRHLGKLLRLKPKEKLTYLKNNLGRRFYSDHSQPLPQAYQLSPLRQALAQADSSYVPQVYPGRAIIFRASEPLEGWLDWCSVDPQLGWGGLVAGGLELHEFSANHVNMFREPNVRYLAEKLKACLDAVQVD